MNTKWYLKKVIQHRVRTKFMVDPFFRYNFLIDWSMF